MSTKACENLLTEKPKELLSVSVRLTKILSPESNPRYL